MNLRVCVVPARGAAPAVQLAGSELIRWLSAGCPRAKLKAAGSPSRADVILGTFEDLRGILGGKLANDRWRDEIVVRSLGGRLVLAGSNARSVLFAVYSYLDGLGFAWLTPGKQGLVVPRLKSIPLEGYDLRHRASLIYRGFGLAGAYDAQMGVDFVEWMARNRFNHLFLEGTTRRSSYQQALGREVSLQQARRYDRQIAQAAKRRGLIFESVGHGWTARVLGFGPERRRKGQFRLSPRRRLMACQIDGVRGIHRNSPGNTHLCLSNRQANAEMARVVSLYARKRRDLDVLSVWLADGFNNWCECPRCAKVHPSDLWAALINRIARAVHAVRPDLMIEVLGYSALMEPPPTQRIENKAGNVIFMYAPFLRCYLHRLDDARCRSDAPLKTFPPANRLHHPMNAEFFEFFRTWRSRFRGTNYVFDYYCWLPIKRDFFEGNVPRTMCLDLKSYPAHGITGMVDCSRAQSFWPTPLARWLQARASWDAGIDYRRQRRILLELAYGRHADLVGKYLDLAYKCLLPARHGRQEERAFSPAKVRRFRDSLPAVRRALGQAAAKSKGPARKFLRRVAVHADFTLLHVKALLAESAGRYDQAAGLAEAMHALARRNGRVLAGAADRPEIDWLRRDTLKRLAAKKQGTWRRID